MIQEIKVTCVSGCYLKDDWIRIFEIDSPSSLYDLYEAIQDAIDFNGNHLYDFYAGTHAYHRKLIFVDDQEWEDREDRF